jgi:hypothetical protein
MTPNLPPIAKDNKDAPSAHPFHEHGFFRRKWEYARRIASNPFSTGGLLFSIGAAALNAAPTPEGVIISSMMAIGGAMETINGNKEQIRAYQAQHHPAYNPKTPPTQRKASFTERLFRMEGLEHWVLAGSVLASGVISAINGGYQIPAATAMFLAGRALFAGARHQKPSQPPSTQTHTSTAPRKRKRFFSQIGQKMAKVSRVFHENYITAGELLFAVGSSILRYSPTAIGMSSSALVLAGGLTQAWQDKNKELRSALGMKPKKQTLPPRNRATRALIAMTHSAGGYAMQFAGLALSASQAPPSIQLPLGIFAAAAGTFAIGRATLEYKAIKKSTETTPQQPMPKSRKKKHKPQEKPFGLQKKHSMRQSLTIPAAAAPPKPEQKPEQAAPTQTTPTKPRAPLSAAVSQALKTPPSKHR